MSIPAAPPLELATIGNLRVPLPIASSRRPSLARSVLLGLAAGHRAMTPLAVLALESRRRRPALAVLATLLAIGELVADKLPSTPTRTSLAPALGRLLAGALAGRIGAVRACRSRTAGALLGAAAALATTHLGLRFRLAATRAISPIAAAVVEDVLASSMAIGSRL